MSGVKAILAFCFIQLSFYCSNGQLSCPENEEEQNCQALCPVTCETIDQVRCLGIVCGTPKCECKSGFIRSAGKCVPEGKCPEKPKCGPNEVYTYESACTTTCDNYQTPHLCGVFKYGCHCTNGTIRDTSSNKCVTPEQCPKKIRCGLNEGSTNCVDLCPETCQNVDQPRCLGIKCGPPTCICKSGFLRFGKRCVPRSTCPRKVCQANEVLGECGNPCQPSCENPNRQPCPTFACIPGCFCAKGLIRQTDDESSPCIRPDKCPKKPCGKNERPVQCVNPCPPSCDDPMRLPCPTLVCQPGYECKPGYIRKTEDMKSPCIKIEECPNPDVCTKNQTFNACGSACSVTCQNPVNTKLCIAQCIPKCDCKPDYIYDEISQTCVLREDCPNNLPVQILCGENEEVTSCENVCPPTCANPNRPPCLPYKCTMPSCVCKKGFIRSGENGPCIPMDKCPKKCFAKCPANFVTNCRLDNCQPTCENPDISPCPSPQDGPGCECQRGWVKPTHASNVCILKSNCKEELNKMCEAKDPNSFYNFGCGGNCVKGCIPRPCPYICMPGCQCKEGFKVHDSDKCIPESECPKPTF